MLNAVWMYKNTLGLFKYGKFMQMTLGILNIILSVVFGRLWGIFGILFATTVSRLLTTTWYDPYVIFRYSFQKSPILYLKRYSYYLIILLITAICCKSVLAIFSGSILKKVFIDIIVCSIITNLIFYIFFYRTAEFKKLKLVLRNILGFTYKK